MASEPRQTAKCSKEMRLEGGSNKKCIIDVLDPRTSRTSRTISTCWGDDQGSLNPKSRTQGFQVNTVNTKNIYNQNGRFEAENSYNPMTSVANYPNLPCFGEAHIPATPGIGSRIRKSRAMFHKGGAREIR